MAAFRVLLDVQSSSENAAPPQKKDTMSHPPLLSLARKFNDAH